MTAIFRKCCQCAIMVLVLFLSFFASGQTILRVDGLNGSDVPPNFGDGWNAAAFKFLPNAISHANAILEVNPNTTVSIWVRGGSNIPHYRPDQFSSVPTNERWHFFKLRVGIRLIGGFNGEGDDEESDADPVLRPTYLTGEIGQAGHADNSYHVVQVIRDPAHGAMTVANTRLDGFIITRGNGNGAIDIPNNQFWAGGGRMLLHNEANLRVHRCVFIDNRAGTVEGTPDPEGDIPTPPNTYGAGVQVNDSAPVFTLCTFSGNEQNSGSVIYGGGMVVQNNSIATLLDCSFNGNKAGHGGGLAVKVQAHALVVNTLLFDNEAVQSQGNNSPAGGGVSVDRTASITIVNSTIANNEAADGGGYAQYRNSGQSSVITNTIIWGNVADHGDEMYVANNPGSLTVKFSDVRLRTTGGVYDAANVNWGTPNAGNIGDDLIADDPDFANANPSAGPLNFHLQCGSACIDTGDTDTTLIPADLLDLNGDANTAEKTPDLDLEPRIAGTLLRVDMGSYEKPIACCIGDTNIDGVVNVTDLLAVIGSWGACGGCPTDISPQPCGDGQVDVSDLLAVIGTWGPCAAHCPGTGGLAGGIPQSYFDCQNMCAGLSGQEWADCMNKCFVILCEQGQHEFCQP